ncbi:MAG: hypothetical protein R3F43_30120 [bacterium]
MGTQPGTAFRLVDGAEAMAGVADSPPIEPLDPSCDPELNRAFDNVLVVDHDGDGIESLLLTRHVDFRPRPVDGWFTRLVHFDAAGKARCESLSPVPSLGDPGRPAIGDLDADGPTT